MSSRASQKYCICGRAGLMAAGGTGGLFFGLALSRFRSVTAQAM